MLAIFQLLGTFVANLFRSRRRLEVENLFLRHQLNIALRRAPHRLLLRGSNRALLVWMTWLWPSLLGLSRIVQPDTILRWHRGGFRAYWRWKSRGRPGRPRVSRELRDLIQRMSKENPLWGCPYRKSKAAGPLPANRAIFSAMVDLFRLVWCFVAELFRSRAALQAEILVLRHQLNVLRRKSPKRLVFRNIDRLVFAGLYGLTPGVRNALKILKPG